MESKRFLYQLIVIYLLIWLFPKTVLAQSNIPLSDCQDLSNQLEMFAPLSIKNTLSYNWGGIKEKWFIDRNNQGYYLYPDPGNSKLALIRRWDKTLQKAQANPDRDPLIGSTTRNCYNNLLVTSLFPKPNVTVVSHGAIVTGSSSINSKQALTNIIDGKLETIWYTDFSNSSSQWVLIDLKKLQTINRMSMDLYMNDNGEGRTMYSIFAGGNPNALTKIINIDRITQTNEHIEIPFLKPISDIRYIKISFSGSSKYLGFKEVNIYRGTEPVKYHLQYFGYYYGDYQTDAPKLLNSNIAVIFYDSNIRKKLLDNYQNNLLTIINFGALLFNTSQRHYTLRNDWLTRWNQFSKEIEGLEHTIYSMYFDEPTSTHTISQSDFLTITNKIRQTYPSMPIMIVEGGDEFPDPLLTEGYLANVTDIAFDFYFIRNGSPDNYTGWGQYLTFYEKFESIAKNRKIWIVTESIGKIPSHVSRLPDVFERYLGLALTKSNVKGLFIYKWPRDLEENINYSVISLVQSNSPNYNASYKARLKSVGISIINNTEFSHSPDLSSLPSLKLGDSNRDMKVDGIDYDIWFSHYNQSVTGATNGDFNNSGKVDGVDYVIWFNSYGK